MGISVQRARLSLVFGTSLILAACGGDDGPGTASTNPDTPPTNGTVTPPPSSDGTAQNPPTGTQNPSTGGSEQPPSTTTPPGNTSSVKNAAPFIKGTPQPTILQDTPYVFVPEAADGDGDILHFKVSNPPPWAQFEPMTGRLFGTPSPADIGTYANIKITVTDGADDAALQPFSITVTPVASGGVELSWAPPTENADGSALTDLAGYKIYWGTQPDEFTSSITIDNPGVVTYVLDNLVPATYYFVATAFNADGGESDPSDMTSLTIS